MDLEKLKEQKKEAAEYICSQIETVIKTCGKRDPGSEGEAEACRFMADELKDYADEVTVEDFKLNPESFYGWIPITVSCLLAAFVAYFFLPVVAMVLLVAGVSLMIGEFVFYLKISDKLYLEKTSHNITALKKPSGEIKRRVLFNGHIDAAWEWTINHKFGGKAMTWQVIISFLGVIYMAGIIVAALVISGFGYNLANGVVLWLGVAAFIFVPFWISIFWLSDRKYVVDGANDNLTGCYLSVAVLKAMTDNGIKLENTEVGALLTGSEEAGLRGAKAWAALHKKDFKDVPTYIISFDTIRDEKFLTVNKFDLNSLVPTDAELGDLYKKAADNVGATCLFGAVPVGATDCAAFTQGGFRSTGITAMDHDIQPYYHTRKDSYDNLSPECLATTFAVNVECLDLIDKGALDKKEQTK